MAIMPYYIIIAIKLAVISSSIVNLFLKQNFFRSTPMIDKSTEKKSQEVNDNIRLKALNLYDDENVLAKIASALSVKTRREILKLINVSPMSINEIAWKLNVPVSTVSFHVKSLVEAGLLIYSTNTKRIGNEKLITLGNYLFTIYTGNPKPSEVIKTEAVSIDIPIGSYTDYKVLPTCGITTTNGQLLVSDAPCIFSSPNRFDAGLIWLKQGYLEYSVPILNYSGSRDHVITYNDKNSIISLSFKFEICSECAGYNHDFKSDITFSANGIELCTYTSPGDFGERRGRLNPEWFSGNLTQYGLLQNLDIRFDGTYLNEKRVSDVCIADLNLNDNNLLTFKIEVKDDAKHIGGFNLFGKNFGDYPQDITLTITYQTKNYTVQT